MAVWWYQETPGRSTTWRRYGPTMPSTDWLLPCGINRILEHMDLMGGRTGDPVREIREGGPVCSCPLCTCAAESKTNDRNSLPASAAGTGSVRSSLRGTTGTEEGLLELPTGAYHVHKALEYYIQRAEMEYSINVGEKIDEERYLAS
eukprot:3736371-Rhodomonas_salina.1